MDPSKRSVSHIEDPEDGPSGVKHKSDQHLRQLSDDATKAHQDVNINRQCEEYGLEEPLNLRNASLLLVEIVRASEDELNHRYMDFREARTLVIDSPFLLDCLRVAWFNKRYEEIRNLEILRNVTGPPASPGPNAEKFSSTFVHAWGNDYEGENHILLLDSLNRLDRETDYSNYVAIIQSSGSGKSRMVYEQAALVFTLPFNLRASNESQDGAYPPPDIDVANYLLRPASSFDNVQRRFAVFFKCLFSVVQEELSRIRLPHEEKAFAVAWRAHLNSERSRMYKDVVAKSQETLAKKAHDEVQQTVSKLELEAHQALVELLLSMNRYCSFDPNPKPPNRIKIILYFDEAHELFHKQMTDGRPYHHFDALCGSLNAFRGQPIFAIFLSTDSSLSVLAPPRKDNRSARAPAGRLQAPFTETPFDCSPIFPLELDELNYDDTCQIKFLAQFGRPMFWSVLKVDDNFDVVNFARRKLMGYSNINAPKTIFPPHALTALVDILIMLDFEPRREAHEHLVEMVAGHMRTAYSVPDHRQYFRSGYSSEPILAEAAARQIVSFQDKGEPSKISIGSILNDRFGEGLISLGERGEIVMRVLLMEAYLRAVRADYPDDSHPIYSKGCKLITFLKELLAKKYIKTVLEGLPNNLPGGEPLQKALSTAMVRFTHFVKAEDESVLGTTPLLAALVRGMAYIGWSSQKQIDFAIPVLLDPIPKLSPSSMSVLLIQVKRRKQRCPVDKYEINQKDLDVFPEDVKTERPYLTLVAELGIQDSEEIRILPQPKKQSHTSDTRPRYAIIVYGCSDIVYNGIPTSDVPLYQQLLAINQLYNEHPRRHEENLTMLKQQKPLWSTKHSYTWLDESVGKTNPEPDSNAMDAGCEG